MRRTSGLSIVVTLSLLALPAVGQDGGGNVGVVHCFDVQPGAEARFEEGLKKHTDWHRKQNDTWTWTAWTVMTGPNTGRYCGGTFGHKWEDFDKPNVPHGPDMVDMRATFLPFVTNQEASFAVNMPKVSRPAAEPTPMSSVVIFSVRFGMDDEFNYLIGEIHKAIEKTEMPWNYQWFTVVSGAEAGTYILVWPRANFASFNPAGKPFDEMLEEAYGRKGAEALLASWRNVVKGSENHLTQARPDLGYFPEP